MDIINVGICEQAAIVRDLRDQDLHRGGEEVWTRSGFCCEYCGIRFLEDMIAWESAHDHHILPQSKYPRLIEDSNNHSMACIICHRLIHEVGGWDPAEGEGDEHRYLEKDTITDDERSQLLKKCCEQIKPLRVKKEKYFESVKQIARRHGLI
jgi:hypothetical protein